MIFVFKCVILKRIRAYNLLELVKFITKDWRYIPKENCWFSRSVSRKIFMLVRDALEEMRVQWHLTTSPRTLKILFILLLQAERTKASLTKLTPV